MFSLSPARGSQSLADDTEFFEKSIRPLLVAKCWPCHGDLPKTKGGLRLTSRANILQGGDSGPAAVSGKPGESLLVQAVRYDQELKMPPKGKLRTARSSSSRAGSRWGSPGPRRAPATTTTCRRSPRREIPNRSAVLVLPPDPEAGAVPAVRDNVLVPVGHRPLHPGRARGEGA